MHLSRGKGRSRPHPGLLFYSVILQILSGYLCIPLKHFSAFSTSSTIGERSNYSNMAVRVSNNNVVTGRRQQQVDPLLGLDT